VESAVKQIGKRLKISGAQWKLENVLGFALPISMVSLLPDLCKGEMLPSVAYPLIDSSMLNHFTTLAVETTNCN